MSTKKPLTKECLKRLKMKFWKKPSIFEDCYCSVYSSGFFSKPHIHLKASFLDILTTEKFQNRDLIERIRAKKTKEEQAPLKAMLQFATISSVQKEGERGKNHHLESSRFIQFDVDNMHKEDIEIIKYSLMVWPYTAYLSLSAGGKGLWGLIKVAEDCANDSEHKEYWHAMEMQLNKILSQFKDTEKNEPLTIDRAPSSIASIRYFCFEPDAYINHYAEIFTDKLTGSSVTKERVKPNIPSSSRNNLTGSLFEPIDDHAKRLQERVAIIKAKLAADPEAVLNGKEKADLWNGAVSAATIDLILLEAGYNFSGVDNTDSNKLRYTRPGKDDGVSAEYHQGLKTFHIFSSNAPMYEKFMERSGGRLGATASGSPYDILKYYKASRNAKSDNEIRYKIYQAIDEEFNLKGYK